SIAAPELARASGCVLLPVYLPRTDRGYTAHILPEISYDRASLRAREARLKLSQEIMRAFEPAIRQHLDQWYHFVPIWPRWERGQPARACSCASGAQGRRSSRTWFVSSLWARRCAPPKPAPVWRHG